MKKTFFKPRVATKVLVEKAKRNGLVPSDAQVRGPITLQKQRLLPWSAITAKRTLSGSRRYPILPEHARDICERFAISPLEWSSITTTIDDEIDDRRPENPIPSSVKRFLMEFGIQGLSSATTLLPPDLSDRDIAAFCVPARVVTEDEWQSVTGARLGIAGSGDELNLSRVARLTAGVLLNTWLGREHRRTVLFGEPGEGKTTAIWLYVAAQCAKWAQVDSPQSLDSGDFRIPLVLPLRKIAEDESRDVLTLAIEHAQSLIEAPAGDRKEVDVWLNEPSQTTRIILVLDGFDELPVSRHGWLRRELGRHAELSVLLTSRYHADPSVVLRSYRSLRMVPLRWWIVDEYIHRYFENHPDGTALANDLRSELRSAPGFRQLAQNPLLLAALCTRQISGSSREDLHSRAEVLGGALRVLMERGDQKRGFPRPRVLRNEEKIRALSQLAWWSYRLGPVAMSEVEAALQLGPPSRRFTHDPPANAEALLEEFVSDGILVRQAGGPFTFLLRRFHEFCLARHLAERLAALRVDEAQRLLCARSGVWNRRFEWPEFRPLNHPAWRDLWSLLAGTMGTNTALIEAAVFDWQQREDLVDSRLRLLAEVLGEFLASNRHNAGVAAECRDLSVEVIEAVLDRVASAILIAGLPGSWITTAASLPPELMIPAIVRRLQHAASERQTSAYAMALGEIGTDEARQHLELLIEDPDSGDDVQDQVAIALGHVGDGVSRDVLLRILRNQPRKTMQLSCLHGLAAIADKQAREALVGILLSKDPDADVVLDSLRQCEKLFGPEIEEPLGKLAFGEAQKLERNLPRHTLESSDDIVQQCARVLGRIGRPKSATLLRNLLKFPLSTQTEGVLLQSIAEIGDSSDREFLREQLHESKLSQVAAVALVSVGDETLLEELLKAASSRGCPDSTRKSICEAAGFCRSKSALNFLITRLLKDPSPKVQQAAASSLGSWGGPKALEALRKILDAQGVDDELGLECAKALSLHEDSAGESALLKVLTDSSQPTKARIFAIQTAARCEFDSAREDLYRLAVDPETPPPLKVRALDAIGTIQREQGWRAFRSGGWERP